MTFMSIKTEYPIKIDLKVKMNIVVTWDRIHRNVKRRMEYP